MNLARLHGGRLLIAATLFALPALALAFPTLARQETDAPHPAHIHSGTCETLGDVVLPLTGVAPLASEGAVGPASAIPVEVSVNQVDMPLQEIIDGGHAINIHQSADDIDLYIACGDIGGVISDDGLLIGLSELNDSGHSGVALLAAAGDKTDVTVYLVEGSAGAGTAAAAQESAPATADGEAVSIKDFAFNPPTIEVPVGGSITWSNEDAVPHTATGIDRAVLQSGAISSGSSFTQTFDTAGSFDYFCEFHPNMKGTIVVK